MARVLCLLGLAHAAAAQGRGGGRGGGGADTYCEDHPTECWGQPCSLSSCSCAGYCFADQKLKVFDTAPDADGYSYKFSMCAVLQEKDLPLGCKNYAEDATAVRYKVHQRPLRRWQPGSRPAADVGPLRVREQITEPNDCMQVGKLDSMCAPPRPSAGACRLVAAGVRSTTASPCCAGTGS